MSDDEREADADQSGVNGGLGDRVNSTPMGAETNRPANELVMSPDVLNCLIQSAVSAVFQGMSLRQQEQQHTQVSNVKLPISEIANQIPFYDGDEGNVDVWLRRAESVQGNFDLDQETLLLLATNRLRGRARTWYDNDNGQNDASWSTFSSRLRNYFGSEVDRIALYDKIRARRWMKNERIEDYFMEKVSWLNMLELGSTERISLLIRGIDNDVVRVQLKAMNLSDEDELFTKMKLLTEELRAVRIEQGNRREPTTVRTDMGTRGTNRSTEQTAAQLPPRPRQEEPKCYECGAKGHVRMQCPRRLSRIKCFVCGEFGHRAATCPKREGRAPASNSVAERSDVNNLERISKYHKILKVKEEKMTALIDTGSGFSLIQNSISRKLNLPIHACDVELQGLGEKRIRCSEQADLRFKVDGREYETEAIIIPDKAIRCDVILGRKFLDTVDYTVTKKELRLGPQDEVESEMHWIYQIEPCNENEPELKINENIPIHLKEDITNTIKALFQESGERKGVGNIDVELKIELTDARPIRARPRRLPWSDEEFVKKKVDELLREGTIQRSTSDYASPVVVVRKKNGDRRLCVDYRGLNKVMVRDGYPLPVIEDLVGKLERKRFFTTIDLKNGFHHVNVEEGSRKFTAFVTQDGLYEYTKVPFGLTTAPAVFQRYVNEIFKELTRQDLVQIYMDDILIATETVEQNVKTLKKVIDRCIQHRLELRIDKCRFAMDEIEYLGLRIKENEVRPGTEKTRAISRFPEPKNLQEVRRFLGLTGYFRKFIPKYAQVAVPLTNLMQGGATFRFGPAERNSFELLRSALISDPLLRTFSRTAPTELHCDASKDGYGAALLQRCEDGQLHPVMFGSWKTSRVEKRYPSFRLEALAVKRALEKFRPFLLGLHFRIVTDCQAFKMALSKKDVNRQLGSLFLEMEEYDFDLEHRKGEKLPHVDCLSRAPADTFCISETSREYDKIRTLQEQDEEIARLKDLVRMKKGPSGLEIINGKLVKDINGTTRIYVPRQLRRELVEKTHEELCHLGAEKVLHDLRRTFYFPGMRKYVKKNISNCGDCLRYNPTTVKNVGLLHNIPKGRRPWSTVHIDHLGPLEKTTCGNRHVFELVDAFTKMIFLEPTKTTGTDEVIKALKSLFKIFGTPERIVSDRGTAFTSDQFESFCRKNKIKHVKIAVQTPRANGQAERFNKVIMPALLKISPTDQWDEALDQVQTALNRTVNVSTGRSPCELMMGYQLRNASDDVAEELRHEIEEKDYVNRRDRQREAAVEASTRRQAVNKKYYDSYRRPSPKYQEGDLVMILRTAPPTGSSSKMAPKYGGPYQVKRVLDHDRYVVADLPGERRTQKPYEAVLPPERLRRIPPIDALSDTGEDDSAPTLTDEDDSTPTLTDEDDGEKEVETGGRMTPPSCEEDDGDRGPAPSSYHLRRRRRGAPPWASLMKRGARKEGRRAEELANPLSGGPSCRRSYLAPGCSGAGPGPRGTEV